MYLHELVAQIESSAIELIEPQDPILPAHRVVGYLPLELQKLYSLHKTVVEQYEEIRARLIRTASSAARSNLKEAQAALMMQGAKRNALGYLFWYSVRLSFPELAAAKRISLHKEWAVAMLKEENNEDDQTHKVN